jgi:hypothetical protein
MSYRFNQGRATSIRAYLGVEEFNQIDQGLQVQHLVHFCQKLLMFGPLLDGVLFVISKAKLLA